MSIPLYIPESLEEAVALQAKGGTYIAGGTILYVLLHRNLDVGPALISLEKIPELGAVSLTEDTISLGALTTMDTLEHNETVKKNAFALWQAAVELGGPQIRNRATLGGNIASASPSADCASPLLALNAILKTYGRNGWREIPIRKFFTGFQQTALEQGEILVSVDIPLRADFSAFRKIGNRKALAVSSVSMALAVKGREISVAVSSVSPESRYCGKTSALLTEGGITPETVAAAQELIQSEIAPIDDRWATESYRRTVCRNLLAALLNEAKEAGK